ncbi:MAG: hypothetical protein ACLQU2_01845, partial [Candidatus Binataceae bacterium]
TTDAKGNASCSFTPPVAGMTSLTAAFAGNSTLLPATAIAGFNVMPPPTTIPTFSPRPTGTATSTPKGTPTRTPIPTLIPTHTPNPTHTPTPTRTPRPTSTPTPLECVATTPKPIVPGPTPTPVPGHPHIAKVQSPVLAGASFTINGSGFTKGSVVNFFVSTSTGAINEGPLTIEPPPASTSTLLVVPVPSTITLGQGFVSVVVVNTDQGFVQSNPGFALLEGSAAAGLPSIIGLNSHKLAATSTDPDFAVANVETTLIQGSPVVINGAGFDVTHGAAVDVFCACTGGKLPTKFLNPGDPNLTSNAITYTLPATAPTGPGSIIVSNNAGGSFSAKSNAVSVPLGARILVTRATQSGSGPGSTVTVDGTGFSTLTVINLFNAQAGGTVNLGGLNAANQPRIALTLVNSTRFTFKVPAGAMAGPAFIQGFNPPFLPFTSTGNDPCGEFTLK